MSARDRILEAALQLFADQGYDAVGVQEICTTAKTTKPPLYHHFGSKQGLLEALIANHYEIWFRTLEPATKYRGVLAESILSIAQAFFGFAKAHPTFHRMQLAMWFSAPDSIPHKAVAIHLLHQHHLLEEFFKTASRDHANLQGHHTTYAITLPGMLTAYITSLQSVHKTPDDHTAQIAMKQFLYGVFAV